MPRASRTVAMLALAVVVARSPAAAMQFSQEPAGDSVVAIKPFSEANPAGPIFTKQGASFDKNAQLAKIVKEKMQQIYPRLARKKFGISLTATASFSRSDEGTHHSVDDEVDSIQRKFDLIPYR